jgi:3-methylfumaryl-CoA hydratase
MTEAVGSEPLPSYGGTWTAVEHRQQDTVTAGAAARLHALLDGPGPAPGSGDPVPPLWHWLAFLPDTPQSELGRDGHPVRGSFLPPIDLPRRMFGQGRLRFYGGMAVEEPLERQARVTRVAEKTGPSGRLALVTVAYSLFTDGREVLAEEQDLVYREPPPTDASVSGKLPAPVADDRGPDWPGWSLRRDLAVDERLLFRFSALTYNAHRIHYDRPYATSVEGYRGLVVHGPLQAVALAELCRLQVRDELRSLEFRLVAPAFDPDPLLLRGRVDDGIVTLAAFSAGRLTATAEARLGGHGRADRGAAR